MSVITVSRGSFSGGKAIAECLAARLGYECIDRDVIVERAAAYGVSQDELRDALEKPPGLLERFQRKRYLYLCLIQAALTQEVRTGKAVYHGLAGHLLLSGGPHILRTRIIAPLESRIHIAETRLKISRAEALAYIYKVDADRQKWTHFLYGVDWGDPSLYDIVLNLEYMDIEQACDIIVHLARQRCFDTTSLCQAKLDNMALGARVRADLALNPATADVEFQVVADQGVVTVVGKAPVADRARDIERIASAVHGVTNVNLSELPPVRD